MSAAKRNIGDAEQGATWSKVYKYKTRQPSGASLPIDISNADIRMQVKDDFGGVEILSFTLGNGRVSITDGPNGTFTVTATAADMSAAPAGTYKYDLEIDLYNDGTMVKRLMEGCFVIRPEITTVAPWTLENLESVVMHWDASDATTLSLENTDEVAIIADKRGSYNGTQADSARRPRTGQATIGGRNALLFDGSNDGLAHTELDLYEKETFVVGYADTVGSITFGNTINNCFVSVDVGFVYGFTSVAPEAYPPYPARSSAAVTSGTAFLAQTKLDATLSLGYNGAIEDTGNTYSSGGLTTFDQFGTRSTGTSPFNGAIGEVVVTPSLSDADRQRVEGFLAHKWGLSGSLPVDHPYKLVPPSQ
jgi:hypothetical protein